VRRRTQDAGRHKHMSDLSEHIARLFDGALAGAISLSREHAALKAKYARLARAKQRFAWATAILGALWVLTLAAWRLA